MAVGDQRFGDDRAVRNSASTNDQIEAFIQRIDEVITRPNIEFQVGMGESELGQDWGQITMTNTMGVAIRKFPLKPA